MPLHLTAKAARKLAGLEKAKPTKEKQSVPRVASERQTVGVPPVGALVTHRLTKRLDTDNSPVLGSLAHCYEDGRRVQITVYLQIGAAMLDMSPQAFTQHFTEVSA